MERTPREPNRDRKLYGTAKNGGRYDGTNDAERILETVMHRANFAVQVRDELKEELEQIVRRRGGR